MWPFEEMHRPQKAVLVQMIVAMRAGTKLMISWQTDNTNDVYQKFYVKT